MHRRDRCEAHRHAAQEEQRLWQLGLAIADARTEPSTSDWHSGAAVR